MPTPNEDLAAGCGQEKSCKEPVEAAKSASGEYACPVCQQRESGALIPSSQPASPKQPLQGLHK